MASREVATCAEAQIWPVICVGAAPQIRHASYMYLLRAPDHAAAAAVQGALAQAPKATGT
eukprot:6241343-Prymnesium_polylepis.2